jgi:hypothetical protein
MRFFCKVRKKESEAEKMSRGEWLLSQHTKHVRQLESVKGRISQCQDFLCNPKEKFEMRNTAALLSQDIHTASTCSDNNYSTDIENSAAERKTAEQTLIGLALKACIIQDYINVFDLIMQALADDDRWFVQIHFMEMTTITAMCEMKFPDGYFHSKTAVHAIKNRIVAEVNELCSLLDFYPQGSPPDFWQREDTKSPCITSWPLPS